MNVKSWVKENGFILTSAERQLVSFGNHRIHVDMGLQDTTLSSSPAQTPWPRLSPSEMLVPPLGQCTEEGRWERTPRQQF